MGGTIGKAIMGDNDLSSRHNNIVKVREEDLALSKTRGREVVGWTKKRSRRET